MPTLIKKLGSMDETMRDLVDQLNRALRERDKLIAALLADPSVFAHAVGTTTGAGGITTVHATGCQLQVAGTTVRMRFTTRRPNTNFVYGGIAVIGAARIMTSPALASKSEEVADIRMYDNLGAVVSAASTIFTVMTWAMGPRA